jgi:hypothetical protein
MFEEIEAYAPQAVDSVYVLRIFEFSLALFLYFCYKNSKKTIQNAFPEFPRVRHSTNSEESLK